MDDFNFEFKNGSTGWLDNIIGIGDEYPLMSCESLNTGILLKINDATGRRVYFNTENAKEAYCIIENEDGDSIRLDFKEFMSEERLRSKICSSLENLKKPDMNALLKEKGDLEERLREVNGKIEEAKKKLAEPETKPRKRTGRKL